ncbi:MAG TPA: hypothetical protein VM223_09580 [Planctomycetota bacterium]|nr:hypothetical protein [Planctomycetota bacterium]
MTFFWNGQALEYFDHRYNHTALNMRRVEIPIARWFLQQKLGTRVLEVGNVLSHYGPVTWPVVDLYEPGAINADVMAWKPKEPVDLLVSISTIEHIGVGKYKRATRVHPAGVLARFRSFLAPRGQAVVTAPTGYGLDRELREGTLGADEMWFMRVRPDRIPVEWDECTMEEALAMPPRACSGLWSGGLMMLLCRR